MSLEDYQGPETFVRVFDGALPADQCEYILKAFRADKQGQFSGKIMSGYDPEIKVTTDLRVGLRQQVHPKVWDPASAMIFNVVAKTWLAYLEEVPGLHRLRGPFEDTGYQIQSYARGLGCFKPHVDASGWDTCFRCGSCVIYLNDVEEGGGTIFNQLGIRVAAKQGRVLWFYPGVTHEHEGEVPLSGDKTIVSTFMCFKGYTLMVEGGELHEHFVRAQEI